MYYTNTIGFTLNDGQTCKAGTEDCNKSHSFDPTKKITKIEVIIYKHEKMIMQINFYHHQQRLVKVGYGDGGVKTWGGRVELFEIADDEQLIGCKLNETKVRSGDIYFCGVTWLTMKIRF